MRDDDTRLFAVHPVERADQRDIQRREGHARTLTLSTVGLSLLAHAAVLLTAIFVLPGRPEPPAMPPESSIALVFVPAPADAPSAADASPPATDSPALAATDRSDETPAPEPPPPPVPQATETPVPPPPPQVEDTQPAPEPPPPPVMQTTEAPVPPPPPPVEDTKPAPKEPPPPAVPKPSAKPRAAHAHTTPAAPSHSNAPPEQQSAAIGSAAPSVTAAIVPPRPVAGMETNRAPTYPEIARRRGEQGRVMLRVNVSADGMPLDVEVVATSGHPSLDTAAMSAVRQWRFIPATQAGRSVAASAEVPVRFRLTN
jgi:protein TonB